MEQNDGGEEEERLTDPDDKDERRHRRDKKDSDRKKRSSRHGSSQDDDSSYERRKRKKKKRSRRKEGERSIDSKDSDSEDEEQRRRKKKKSKSRKRSRRDESSSSSSSSDSDSEEDSRRRRKKRKDRKRKKQKSKKKKRSRRDSSDDASVDGGAPTFGSYGIIKAADFLRMQRSFQVWLAEVKGIPSLPGSKHEQQKYFADFCEDFNTATMPHQKYYDYEKWEMQGKDTKLSHDLDFGFPLCSIARPNISIMCLTCVLQPIPEYERQKAKEEKLSVTGNTLLADEARHKREQQERARAKQESDKRALYGSMSREKVEEMKHQAKLRSQMQIAYQTGDKQTYERLKERLEADT
eukprot:scaffold5383_cov222-Amphora_coffeaeformis.AAC.1